MTKETLNIRAALDNEESALLQNPGDYIFAVEDVQPHTSEKDEECAQPRLRVAEGEKEGKLLMPIFSLQPKAVFRFREFVEACGIDASTIENCSELVGCKVRVHVVTEEYQGRERLRAETFERVDQE